CLLLVNRCDQSSAFSSCDSQLARMAIQSFLAHDLFATQFGAASRWCAGFDYSVSGKNRAKIGLSFSAVASGHKFRSVTSAVSNPKCSGQFGSAGTCGTTCAITFLAVSAFATK